MTNLLEQGLILSGLGLGLTFSGLALLVVLMILLERIFRTREPASAPPAAETPDAEIAAVIALALTYLRDRETPHGHIGAALQAGPGRWWQRGLSRSHHPHKSSRGRR